MTNTSTIGSEWTMEEQFKIVRMNTQMKTNSWYMRKEQFEWNALPWYQKDIHKVYVIECW